MIPRNTNTIVIISTHLTLNKSSHKFKLPNYIKPSVLGTLSSTGNGGRTTDCLTQVQVANPLREIYIFKS